MADQLTFHRSLYLPEAVEAVAEAYGHLAKIELEQSDEATVATISDQDKDHAAILVDSFANHVLYETVTRTRAESGEGVL